LTSPSPTGSLAFIPARGGSKRIPRKNVIDFFGKPMLGYPIEAALKSGLFDLVHVSTDDDEIAEAAERLGADVGFRRPAELSDDHTPLLPVTRYTLEEFARRGRTFSDVCTLFPCAPLVDAADISGAYAVFRANGGERNLLTVARSPVPAEWYYHKQPDGRLVPIVPGAAFIRSQDLAPAYFETGTFTIFSADWVLAPGRTQDDTNYVAYELPLDRAIDIDTYEDLERARMIFSMLRRSG
jgi:pseudaminic acid cytidylyltransferase